MQYIISRKKKAFCNKIFSLDCLIKFYPISPSFDTKYGIATRKCTCSMLKPEIVPINYVTKQTLEFFHVIHDCL